MSDINTKSLKLHAELKGKLITKSKKPISNIEELSLMYSPGVAAPCLEIAKNKYNVYKYTGKGNTIAVVSDGTAVLGLGDIGPEAALPVMEAKSMLLIDFANINSFPLCIGTKDTEEIIKFCKHLEPTISALHLEDISAPRCIEIERRLIAEMNIPVFHDDQHGTSMVLGAAVYNACKVTGKDISKLEFIVCGTGSAGSSIILTLIKLGAKNITPFNRTGILSKHNPQASEYNFLEKELLEVTPNSRFFEENTLASIMKGADVFVGVSVGNCVSVDMVKSMNKDPWVFALANPEPEIMPEVAKEGGAYIVGTGRSDYPNQINNLLAFPGMFRGALDACATTINDEMKLATIYAIANHVKENELSYNHLLPDSLDKTIVEYIAKAVKEVAIQTGVVRKNNTQ